MRMGVCHFKAGRQSLQKERAASTATALHVPTRTHRRGCARGWRAARRSRQRGAAAAAAGRCRRASPAAAARRRLTRMERLRCQRNRLQSWSAQLAAARSRARASRAPKHRGVIQLRVRRIANDRLTGCGRGGGGPAQARRHPACSQAEAAQAQGREDHGGGQNVQVRSSLDASALGSC